MLGEYERTQKMFDPRCTYFNPWRMVKGLRVEKKAYGGLTIREAKLLIDPSLNNGKERDRVYYYAMKLAIMAGLRMGEVCGLCSEDVHDQTIDMNGTVVSMSYLEIKYQWNQRVKKRTLVKNKDTRKIPITPKMREDLNGLLGTPGSFVFSFHPRKEVPMSQWYFRDWFYKQLEQVGISEEDRKTF